MGLPFPGSQVLELGGGASPSFRPNADLRSLPTVDILADFNRPLPIPREAYDGVFCRYVLEHLSWRRVPGFLEEVHRVLRPGGVAIFVTANTLEQCRWVVGLEDWDSRVPSTLFGDQNYENYQWDANAHHAAFSPGYATSLLSNAGFYSVQVQPIETGIGPTDMTLVATKSAARIERGTLP